MIGSIVYLHMYKLAETLAVKQVLDKNRFVKIIEETPVKGGKQDEQYMQYKAVSLLDPNKVYTINNYLSPFNFTDLSELEMVLDFIEPAIDTSRMEAMYSILHEIKQLEQNK